MAQESHTLPQAPPQQQQQPLSQSGKADNELRDMFLYLCFLLFVSFCGYGIDTNLLECINKCCFKLSHWDIKWLIFDLVCAAIACRGHTWNTMLVSHSALHPTKLKEWYWGSHLL
jgi:hypothetical protein